MQGPGAAAAFTRSQAGDGVATLATLQNRVTLADCRRRRHPLRLAGGGPVPSRLAVSRRVHALL
jgi:hypothetical protein